MVADGIETAVTFSYECFSLNKPIFRGGSKTLKSDFRRLSNPLNTDRITIRAMVPVATPTTEMAEIMFITLCDFFASR